MIWVKHSTNRPQWSPLSTNAYLHNIRENYAGYSLKVHSTQPVLIFLLNQTRLSSVLIKFTKFSIQFVEGTFVQLIFKLSSRWLTNNKNYA